MRRITFYFKITLVINSLEGLELATVAETPAVEVAAEAAVTAGAIAGTFGEATGKLPAELEACAVRAETAG